MLKYTYKMIFLIIFFSNLIQLIIFNHVGLIWKQTSRSFELGVVGPEKLVCRLTLPHESTENMAASNVFELPAKMRETTGLRSVYSYLANREFFALPTPIVLGLIWRENVQILTFWRP